MSCVPLGVGSVTSGHHRTVTVSEALPPWQPERGHGGVTPHWRSSAGAGPSPTEMSLSGESQGGSRHAVPSLSCPGSVTPAALPAQTRLTWKRQRWPSRARRSQPQGQDVGQEGPAPTASTLAVEPAGRGPGEGNVSQDPCQEGWKLQELGPARASARRALLHLSRVAVAATAQHLQLPEPPAPWAWVPWVPRTRRRWGSPGGRQGWRRAGRCRGAPSPRRAGCGAGPCFLH